MKQKTFTNMHYIRPNRTGFFITGIDYQPHFPTMGDAFKWAIENGIEIIEENE